MTLQPKPARLSRTEHTQIVLKEHINGQNRLFGGRLMEWIDVVAAVAARRHAGYNVTTASIDTLNFKAPAFINDTIVLVGKVTYAGRTSMEVRVDTFREALDGTRELINRAYMDMVAIDCKGKPMEVPLLALETEEQQAEWEAAQKRRQMRKQRRKEGY